MAVERELNVLGQQRLDAPHLRLVEAGVRGDFDVLGLSATAGSPYVVRGYSLITAGAIGIPAEDLKLDVAGGIAIHYMASASGSVFRTPSDHAPETLHWGTPRQPTTNRCSYNLS